MYKAGLFQIGTSASLFDFLISYEFIFVTRKNSLTYVTVFLQNQQFRKGVSFQIEPKLLRHRVRFLCVFSAILENGSFYDGINPYKSITFCKLQNWRSRRLPKYVVICQSMNNLNIRYQDKKSGSKGHDRKEKVRSIFESNAISRVIDPFWKRLLNSSEIDRCC